MESEIEKRVKAKERALRGEDTPRHTKMHVYYRPADRKHTYDISGDVAADLLNCSYTDCITDESDELSVTLKDERGKWADSWSPVRGDKVEVGFDTLSRGLIYTGDMIIDRLTTSGRPRVFSFSACSIPLDNTIRRTAKTRTFEKSSLKTIANQIAQDNSLKFMWDCQEDPKYDRTDQQQESDLAYLKKLCTDAGFTVKVTSTTLVIFDQTVYEKKKAIKTLTESGLTVLSWSFEAQQSERYKAVTVKWRDLKKKTRSSTSSTASKSSSSGQSRQEILDSYIKGYQPTKGSKVKKGSTATKTEYTDYTYEDPNVDDSGQVYVLKKRCTSLAEAERLARAKLRKLNLRQLTGSLTVVGDPELVAASVIELKGFGSFDGNFIIEKATHSMDGGGYKTSIDVRRVNCDY